MKMKELVAIYKFLPTKKESGMLRLFFFHFLLSRFIKLKVHQIFRACFNVSSGRNIKF